MNLNLSFLVNWSYRAFLALFTFGVAATALFLGSYWLQEGVMALENEVFILFGISCLLNVLVVVPLIWTREYRVIKAGGRRLLIQEGGLIYYNPLG